MGIQCIQGDATCAAIFALLLSSRFSVLCMMARVAWLLANALLSWRGAAAIGCMSGDA